MSRHLRRKLALLRGTCGPLGEELVHYLVVELEGYKFLFDQIKSFNARARSFFLAPAFVIILLHSKKNNSASK
jgi:hypothetical protein